MYSKCSTGLTKAIVRLWMKSKATILALAVFKNILGSAPYQEVLLTPSGHDFYSVSRDDKGRLTMRVAEEAPAYGA